VSDPEVTATEVVEEDNLNRILEDLEDESPSDNLVPELSQTPPNPKTPVRVRGSHARAAPRSLSRV
jgi:hypothetical protein